MSSFLFAFGVVTIGFAGVLYFVFLPHVEGPPPEAQRADRKEWLVQCPNCSKWQSAVPKVSSEKDQVEGESVMNRFKCRRCEHRWEEQARKI